MISFKDFLDEKGAGLWANIRKKKASGKRMRKKGEKGAPTAAAMKSAQEGVSSKERANIKAALDTGKTVTGTSKHIDGKFKILKFTTIVIGVNRIPRALIDDGNKERYIDTMAIDSFNINESEDS